MILVKEPTEEKKATLDAPKPMMVAVEKKLAPPQGTVLTFMSYFVSGLFLCVFNTKYHGYIRCSS